MPASPQLPGCGPLVIGIIRWEGTLCDDSIREAAVLLSEIVAALARLAPKANAYRRERRLLRRLPSRVTKPRAASSESIESI